MNLKTQDAYTTIAMKGSKVYNDLQEMVNKGQIEKRSGVIILTVEEFKNIIGNAFQAGRDYEAGDFELLKPKPPYKTEYIKQLITQ